MIIAFLVLSCLLSAGLVAGVLKMNRYDHPVRPSIQYLFAAAVFPIMFNAASLVAGEWQATLWHGLYFASTDWLVIFLYYYAKQYTGTVGDKTYIRWLMCVGAVADTLSMIVNVGTHHVFTSVEVPMGDGTSCFVVEAAGSQSGIPMYTVHLLFVYTMVVIVLMTFVLKMVRTVRLYRGKYMAVIGSFILILAVNIGYRFVDIPIDLSPVLYFVLAFACVYFSLFYVPKSIVVKLLSLAVEDMESGILCFDKDGKCVYANEMSRKLFDARDSLAPLEHYFAAWRESKQGELREEVWKETHEIDGELHHFESQFQFLLDDRGNYVGSFFSIVDKTEDFQNLEFEQYKATHDNLTDIYNRDYFFERVEDLLRREPDVKRVIACIDVKDFKLVNDLFGEETGNNILKRIALRCVCGKSVLSRRIIRNIWRT